MAFVDAAAYAAFMGRFSQPLSPLFTDAARLPGPPVTVLDVGCGPGALTTELARRYGAASVRAVDPSPAFVEATRAAVPGVDVRTAGAEALPWPDDSVDAALAQLVVHFLPDPLAGLRELARVTRPGGVVAACVWDHAGGRGPLAPFWSAVADLGHDVDDESTRPGAREGQLAELLSSTGLAGVESDRLDVTLAFTTFEQWWRPFTLGVGPAGDHVTSLDAAGRAELEAARRARLPAAPFELTASAWTARGTVA